MTSSTEPKPVTLADVFDAIAKVEKENAEVKGLRMRPDVFRYVTEELKAVRSSPLYDAYYYKRFRETEITQDPEMLTRHIHAVSDWPPFKTLHCVTRFGTCEECVVRSVMDE